MDTINATCMKLSCLVFAISIYASHGLIAGIITFLVGWIFMVIYEEEDR